MKETFRDLLRIKQKLSMEECIRLLKTEKRGVLSVNGFNGYPYGMPMNHWYHDADGVLYFHCGKKGHRLDALQHSDRVSFCVVDQGNAMPGEWALNFKSVIVFGRMKLVDDPEQIAFVSEQLSRKFTDDEQYIQNEIRRFASQTLLLVLTPEYICGKAVRES